MNIVFTFANSVDSDGSRFMPCADPESFVREGPT